MTLGLALSLIGAAISIIGGGIGTIWGTAYVASGGTGLVAQNPKRFGVVLLSAAIPSSQGIYGFLGSILIMQQTEFLGGEFLDVSTPMGLAFIAGSLPVSLLGMFSGMAQGKVLQSGLRIVAKNPSEIGKSIILAVLVESMAVFGLLLTILIVNNLTIS
jgi:V/A-type H+-transporting ATPase subunit K